MKFNLNLQGAQELGNYIQPGSYSVKIKGFENKESKNGHPQIAISFMHKEEGEFTHYANGDTSNDFAKNWLYTFLKSVGIQDNNGQFSFTDKDIIGKPINIELERKYNEYTDKWNTVLKRFWKFEGTPVYEKIGIKENEKNDSDNKVQAQKGNVSNGAVTSDNPFANANGPIDISDEDLPF
ncbi:single stranded DNA-binding domain-containing protein [Staphylococcus delphini]|uniref:DUF669 domain-containing protein n=1 Tax=Staphylococcus delphini TaxID=53344 RepID=UPI0021D1FA1B|nr:DUF669 domain-containing protein [Staphylococcus delphini]UXS22584.1 DUF669 domain-containing protein [Staphylococcus delphini]UXS43568.1 DUF669 domain-containing protein [Staphylococcus delphini]UXS43774.1 DUF669 domain-containing protein [Staphylococcus delphini]UXS45337.1 DUF669 domain-containing protein [Staphylococcus delphini]UXV44262.1 DUF669 domain-containing protein [Staphylococcus delphini]